MKIELTLNDKGSVIIERDQLTEADFLVLAAIAGASSPPVVWAVTNYCVRLLALPPNRVQAIKAIRSIYGLGLAETKELVDSLATGYRASVDLRTLEPDRS